jgi:hypothetical protein
MERARWGISSARSRSSGGRLGRVATVPSSSLSLVSAMACSDRLPSKVRGGVAPGDLGSASRLGGGARAAVVWHNAGDGMKETTAMIFVLQGGSPGGVDIGVSSSRAAQGFKSTSISKSSCDSSLVRIRLGSKIGDKRP